MKEKTDKINKLHHFISDGRVQVTWNLKVTVRVSLGAQKVQCQRQLHSATQWLLISRCSESCSLKRMYGECKLQNFCESSSVCIIVTQREKKSRIRVILYMQQSAATGMQIWKNVHPLLFIKKIWVAYEKVSLRNLEFDNKPVFSK